MMSVEKKCPPESTYKAEIVILLEEEEEKQQQQQQQQHRISVSCPFSHILDWFPE